MLPDMRKGPDEAPSWLIARFHARLDFARSYFVAPCTPCPHAKPLYCGFAARVASSELRCQTGPLFAVARCFLERFVETFALLDIASPPSLMNAAYVLRYYTR